jgi:hypothetical protein
MLLPLNNPLGLFQHVLRLLTYATTVPRPALAEENVSKLPKLDAPVLFATVEKRPQERVRKSKQIIGQGKAANGKISAGTCSFISDKYDLDKLSYSPFVLLSGTVIVIILLIVGSISLLYGVGDQPLPSILLATAVNAKKD